MIRFSLGGRRSLVDFRDHPFSRHPAAVRAGRPLPRKVDHRVTLPPAWDQSFIGSCEAHGCLRAGLPFWAAAVDGFSPSRLAAYAWAREKGGISLSDDGGCYTRDMLKVMQDGLYDERNWPYEPERFREIPTDGERLFQIAGYTQLTTAQDLMTYVAMGGLAPFAMNLPDYFDGLGAPGTDAVVPAYNNEHLVGEHCMCVVGYDMDMGPEPYAITCNSWGIDWGVAGHCFIPFSMILDSRIGGDCWAIYPAGNM